MIRIVLVSLLIAFCSGKGYVPVVLWTNIGKDECNPSVPVTPAEPISTLTRSKYFECLRQKHPEIIKIFVTSELDEYDFIVTRDAAGTGKAFSHLQSSLKNNPSVVMPAVLPNSVAATLENTFENSFGNAAVSVVDVGRIDRSSIQSTRRSISLLDETMSEEMLKLNHNKKFIAVFTAGSPPQPVFFSDEEYLHHGRQLLSITEFRNETQTLVQYNSCIILSYSNLTLTYATAVYNLTDPTVLGGSCDPNKSDTTSISISFTGAGNGKANLDLKFQRSFSSISSITWWNISSASLTHAISGKSTKYVFQLSDHYAFTAPDGWSWVCEKPPAMRWQNTSTSQSLQFENMQVQPFSVESGRYSRAQDCSGFLTGPIWMGVVIAILLGIIFTFGIMGMAAVTTMDRFDDPRGKSITVNTQDN